MTGRGYSIADILNPSSPGGSSGPSPGPPNNQPDHSTMGIIASNSNNNQENTPILTDTGNNPNNTSVETAPGLRGELIYTRRDGNDYIRIRGDVNGDQIAVLQREALASCELETIRMPGVTGPIHVLNLSECTSLEPFAEGRREGVWIPDVLRTSDLLKNHTGGTLNKLNGKILVTRQIISRVKKP